MKKLLLAILLLALPGMAMAHGHTDGPSLGPVRIEFILFALTLIAVALFHNKTMQVALIGLGAILIWELFVANGFNIVEHFFGSNGFIDQIIHKEKRQGEWAIILNLLGLLLGFSILAKHFEESGVPQILPKYLPEGWVGGFVLLILIAFISSFLDNIAGAMIGGTVAATVFRGKVHIGYLAAIVAASNAGGSGSVVGDTTTTMIWIAGVPATGVLKAFVAAVPALIVFGIIAAKQQHKYQAIAKDASVNAKVYPKRLIAVGMILVGTIATNFLFDFPALGVWVAIMLAASFNKTPWKEAKLALSGSVFLLSLVVAASMMPVDSLPPASWPIALSLGFVSAVFDNIPLTKLALTQGGYDWGVLAYAVGFGGSMIWFGSSAGVALSNLFPEAKSVGAWIKNGWHVALAYVIGFFIMIGIAKWVPDTVHVKAANSNTSEQTVHE
jgi:Na+/H+ antiporter NhaD/arsenite permease-like protein